MINKNGETSKAAVRLSYLYIAIPFLIFALGFMRAAIAVPVALVTAVCLFFMIKDAPALYSPPKEKKTYIIMAAALIIIFIWVFFSGIGKLSFQTEDHRCRNEIFDLLVNNTWPIKYSYADGSSLVLIYYIAFWLPAAVIGKLLGLYAGYLFQVVWAVIGIYLFFMLASAINKKFSLTILLIFIFFSGLDIIGAVYNRMDLKIGEHLEWWTYFAQFSSFTTQLYWVFNQSLPAWIITALLYVQKNNKYLVFIVSFSLLASTLPFIGLIPFAAYFALSRKYDCGKGLLNRAKAF
ncbi:MAG: hypothetical protein K6F09_00680, partial [Clostridiales bacterium]|nr:hypothetical protein [Clostridiales bacterium]